MKAKKNAKPAAAPPEKVYFLKNPDGFLFSHIFASGKIRERLRELTGRDSDILPVSLMIAPLAHINTLGICVLITLKLPAEFPGAAFTVAPVAPAKKAAESAGLDAAGFFQRLFEPVGGNIAQLIQKPLSGVSLTCKNIKTGDVSLERAGYALWITYHIDVPGVCEFFLQQAVNRVFLASLCTHFLDQKISWKTLTDPPQILQLVRDVNYRFQEHLIRTVIATSDRSVELPGDHAPGGAPYSLNLEELRLVPDRTIRALLEEVSRKRMRLKTLVFALSGLSEELRDRFIHNMSRNRRSEVKEGFTLWEGTRDEIIEAQRELAWILIGLAERGAIAVSQRLHRQLKELMRRMDEALARNAAEYIRSDTFGSAMRALNAVLLQVLIRRVSRRLLIQALSCITDSTRAVFFDNMTASAQELIRQDIEHWMRGVDECRKVIAAAAAQHAVIRQAAKLKKEFARSPF